MYISSSSNRITKKGALLAPYSYWKSALNLPLNGCGTTGIIGAIVPDSLLGTNITDACNIHDYMYSIGQSNEYRKIADQVFLDNMIEAIEKDKSSFIVKFLRKIKAHLYYMGVRLFGGAYFSPTTTNSKQKSEN